jgi:GNAT superfamily N-acetyltransferase
VVRVRRVEPGEGLLLKSVRLAALEESPDAFSSTHAAEVARSDKEWEERAQAGSSGVSRITVFAEGAQGVVGLIGGYRATDSSTTVELVSMWVSPSVRRAGVGRALVAAIIDWARLTEASEVALGVVEGNAAAERLYMATGFTATGTALLWSNPSLVEVRMAKPIV